MAGEKNEYNPEEHLSVAVTRANEERGDLLDELFGVMPSASKADKALIDQNFGARDRRTAHSPMLQRKVAYTIESAPTLTEQVRIVLHRR